MKKTIFLLVLLLSQIQYAQAQKIDFKWEKDSLNGKLIEKIAMSVPFFIENKEYRFQFDLGANTTLIYDKCFEKTQFIKNRKIDKNSEAAGHQVFSIENQNIKIGDFKKNNYKLSGLLNFDQDEACGVVGADIFQYKILIIDFPNNQILITDKLSKKQIEKANLIDIKIINNKPIIPVKIDGLTYHFQYDSGASIFPVFTYLKKFEKLINSSKTKDSLNIKNFNNPLIVKAVEIDKQVMIGENKFNTRELWYSDNDLFGLENDQIDGIIGNVFFLDKKIVIDFKNKKFGIL
ncbi:hypothetical protein [Chryseobacterium taiwanense]|uniref:Peptidase A2 domain-containing protein n=1 Tax=Chryseobacterium taiwanense TaxID=363331 RepID=A0A0B4DEP5_9FLAO|nr:hypothetical protein [Chryseobacterium taiwanense]KIC65201.1 hypothetical protein RM51_01760 [Chryseobacterium taiwanense]